MVRMIKQSFSKSSIKYSDLRKGLLKFNDGTKNYLEIDGMINILENRVRLLTYEFMNLVSSLSHITPKLIFFDVGLQKSFECMIMNAKDKVPNSPSILSELSRYDPFQ